jgi:hypothetical protein
VLPLGDGFCLLARVDCPTEIDPERFAGEAKGTNKSQQKTKRKNLEIKR